MKYFLKQEILANPVSGYRGAIQHAVIFYSKMI